MLNHRISFVILSTALFLSGHAATLSGTVQDSANGSPCMVRLYRCDQASKR